MGLERLGIAEERAADRAKWGHHWAKPARLCVKTPTRRVVVVRSPHRERRLEMPANWSADKKAAARQIVMAACRSFSVTEDEIVGPRHPQSIALARFAAVRLLRDRMGLSTTRLGKMLGRDHTTIISALKRATKLLGRHHDWTARYHAAYLTIEYGA